MPSCKAKFCTVQQGKGIHTFLIPDPAENRNVCEKWIHNLGIEKLTIQTFVYGRHNTVCEKHFEQDCFVDNMQAKILGYVPMRKKLEPDAVPTIFEDSKEPSKRELSQKKYAKKERAEMLDHLLNADPETPSNSDDCQTSQSKGKVC